LSFGKENVIFPRMSYRRKKIEMKERLEEAIEEIRGEPPQGSGFEREMQEEAFSEIESAAPGLPSRTVKPTVGTRYTPV
jgi:hypothetical protein